MKRKRILVEVAKVNNCDDKDWPPMEAKDFLEWVKQKINLIPDAFIDDAYVEICEMSREWWEESEHQQIEVYYHRPETDIEMAERAEKKDRDFVESVNRRFGLTQLRG